MEEKHSHQEGVFLCRSHLLFCPKDQRKVLVPPVDERLKTMLTELMERWGQELLELEVRPARVHLLVGCDPRFGIHRLVKLLKGTSSRVLQQEFMALRQGLPGFKRSLPSLWTDSYFCATVGSVTPETLQQYVEGLEGR